MKYTYEYPRALVTVDAIILDRKTKSIVLLIQRRNDPYKGMWALPGGFIEMDEKLEESVAREVLEETNLEGIDFTQFKAFGNPGRDPRDRNICVVFYGYCDNPEDAKAGDDAVNEQWFELNNLPVLAFDHADIMEEYLRTGDR